MMFKFIFSIFFLTSVIFASGCLRVKTTELPEISINDANPDLIKEVSISDDDINRSKMYSNASRTQPAKINTLKDNSEIITMLDGYGNKTERRYFYGNPRVELVLVRTASDGRTQVVVYGFGEETVLMPDDFAGTALNASADEIAKAARLTNTRPFKPTIALATPTPVSTQTIPQTQVAQVQTQPNIETEVADQTEVQKTEENIETEKPANSQENRQPR